MSIDCDVWKDAPDAATEARVDYYKDGMHMDPETSRIFTRKRFTPKNGDCVLVDVMGVAEYAIAHSSHEIYTWNKNTGEKVIVPAVMKPFDPSKLGEPWSEA